MKKRKPPVQAPGDFKHNPFKSLKAFAPKPASPGSTGAAAPVFGRRENNDRQPEDEAALFLRAVEGAKKIDHAREDPFPPVRQEPPNRRNVADESDKKLFLQAMQKIGAAFRDEPPELESDEQARQSPTSRLRQLKRGTLRIAQELDLHGFLKEEAVLRLEQFVTNACSQGQKAVLVITGKGINSPDGPVLQGAVAEWLRSKGRGMVVEFSAAPRNLGGSGAFVVFLKKK